MKKDSLIDKRYRIDNVIGRGGTSVIYKAHDIKGGRICAVKQSGDDISREARLLRELNHPRIPSIWDVVEENGYTYMIMDYKPGRTLLDIAQSKVPQRAEDVVWWMIQLVQVIGYLHSRIPEIIYRDVKPSNIILGDDNTISLVDFGAAKKYNSRASKDRIYIGTAGYAAPEQFGGKGQTDVRTDIYGIGAVMYHMITGVRPAGLPYSMDISGNEKEAVLIPEDIKRIIEKCVRHDRNQRYQSCTELIADLYALRERQRESQT